MNLNFSTNNWETIANGWKLFSLLIFFSIIVFKKPLSERLAIFIQRGYKRKEERKQRIDVARAMVSNRRLNSASVFNGDLTDENAYLAIRRHLSPDSREKIESKHPNQGFKFPTPIRLEVLTRELDRLSKKWRLPV